MSSINYLTLQGSHQEVKFIQITKGYGMLSEMEISRRAIKGKL